MNNFCLDKLLKKGGFIYFLNKLRISKIKSIGKIGIGI